MYITDNYDVIVVGAGHAGVEAALAAARLGGKTLLATLSMDNIALMPCNPSVGGPAKGHLVREIDALGGEMGIAADKACIQMRLLNTGKGYAVQALRAQEDKPFYHTIMKQTVENQDRLDVKQLMIDKLLASRGLGDEYKRQQVLRHVLMPAALITARWKYRAATANCAIFLLSAALQSAARCRAGLLIPMKKRIKSSAIICIYQVCSTE